MLKSICCLSFPGGLDGTLEPMQAIAWAREYGFEAAELCISEGGPCGLDLTEARCAEIKAEADRAGIQLPSLCSGLYWSRALGDADEAKRRQAREDIEQMVKIASWLGAGTLLVIPGAVDVFFLTDRPPQPYDEVWRYAQEGLRDVLPTAERHQVRLGIENVWNRFLLSPVEMRGFIDEIGSPWLGAYLDVGNVLAFGYPEQWIAILQHRIVGVHFKDYRRAVGTAEGFVDLLEGDVDWPAVTQGLRDVGYTGPVAAEMIPHYRHYPLVRVAKASRAMDAILRR